MEGSSVEINHVSLSSSCYCYCTLCSRSCCGCSCSSVVVVVKELFNIVRVCSAQTHSLRQSLSCEWKLFSNILHSLPHIPLFVILACVVPLSPTPTNIETLVIHTLPVLGVVSVLMLMYSICSISSPRLQNGYQC